MDAEDLCFMPAVEMAAAVRAKELSPVEIVETVLARIAALDARLNAFFVVTADAAMAEARRIERAVMQGGALGPLAGVPVSVKDSMAVKGLPTTVGSKALAGNVAAEDAPLVARLRSAGAIVIGKTTMPEFAWKGVTDSPLHGIARNPWSLDRTPGGSTGGGAAQVAAGLGPLAAGTDGGGSIRIPASFSGIFGIKPTFGRVPYHPQPALDALSHAGPLARTVADAALMLGVMAGPHPADRLSLEAPPADYLGALGSGVRGLHVAWSPTLGGAAVDGEVAAATAEAAAAFAELGCVVEEATPDLASAREVFLTFFEVGIAASIADLLPRWEKDMDPGMVNVGKRGSRASALAFAKAQGARHRLYDNLRRFFERYDLLLTPTVAVLPFGAGAPSPAPEHGHAEDWIDWSPFTYPFNLTQMPAASVPVGFSRAGLPIGLQIVGPRFAELTVLQAAAAFEAARPWAHRRPTLQATQEAT